MERTKKFNMKSIDQETQSWSDYGVADISFHRQTLVVVCNEHCQSSCRACCFIGSLHEPISASACGCLKFSKILSLKTIFKNVTFWITWAMSHVELWLFRAAYLTIFVFARQWHQFQHHRCRRIVQIERDKCYRWFGVNHEDLSKLHSVWWIPNLMLKP